MSIKSMPLPQVASLKFSNPRLAREWKTVRAMIHIYCRDQHGDALCRECQELMRYVSVRLDRCRFGPDKPTCAKCPVHCYQRDSREQIKVVMRYAGPRMMWEHPWLSLWHLLDGWFRRPVLAENYRRDKDAAGQCAQSNLVTASELNVPPDPIVEKLKSIANK